MALGAVTKMKTTQDQRNLQLTTPLGKDFLLINGLRCTEGLNQLFRIDLEMLYEMDNEGFEPKVIDPKSLLGNPMVVVALQAQKSDLPIERFFHGICVSFTQGSRNGRFTTYRAELVPKVWLLTQRSQSRIFQNKSVPEILLEILEGFDFDNEIQGTFEPRNYCVQYRETDWDFACRLMEEEGIYYYFEHTATGHRLILANTPASHRSCPKFSKIPFALERSELKEEWIPAVYSWWVDNKMRTGRYEARDFNFQLPTNSLMAEHTSLFKVGGNNQLQVYDWPGEYAQRFDGIDRGGGEQPAELNKIFIDRERTVKIRQEEIDVGYKTIHGASNCCTLTAGYKFELGKHPTKENNINYVLVNVLHEAVQSPIYISDRPVASDYMVNFACIPHGAGHAPFRPLRKTPKPVVQGSQTAFVVGPAGEEIFTDKYGRVKVQFHWDRIGKMDLRSSCWLRVAQISAGNNWGSMFIPRIGTEVMVNFLEGDPDQPIIAGCVYNPASMPPYTLPDHKTRSTIKTRSSKGGGGFNEIRFEDKKGKEQLFIHAEKNEDIRVKNECMETIGSNRHLIVGGEQRERVYGDKHLRVAGDLNEKIESSMSLQVGGDNDQKIGSKYAVESGKEIHLKAGMKVVIEAGVQLTLKGPGGFIDIGPGGVTVQGTMVLINSGGSAGSGSGASPTSPKSPKEADKADSGKATEKPPAPPPPPSPELTKLKIAAKKVKKHKDKGGANDISPEELARLLKETQELVDSELGKMKVYKYGTKAIKTILAVKDRLPFIANSPPKAPATPAVPANNLPEIIVLPDEPVDPLQETIDQQYYERARTTGKPVRAPDGSTYEVGNGFRSKSGPVKPRNSEGPEITVLPDEPIDPTQEAIDEEYYEKARQAGKPVTAPDGATYEVGNGFKSRSSPVKSK